MNDLVKRIECESLKDAKDKAKACEVLGLCSTIHIHGCIGKGDGIFCFGDRVELIKGKAGNTAVMMDGKKVDLGYFVAGEYDNSIEIKIWKQ